MFSNLNVAVGAGTFTLAANALAGQPWIWQSSTDLAHWLDVATNYSTSGGLVQFTNTINNGLQSFIGSARRKMPVTIFNAVSRRWDSSLGRTVSRAFGNFGDASGGETFPFFVRGFTKDGATLLWDTRKSVFLEKKERGSTRSMWFCAKQCARRAKNRSRPRLAKIRCGPRFQWR